MNSNNQFTLAIHGRIETVSVLNQLAAALHDRDMEISPYGVTHEFAQALSAGRNPQFAGRSFRRAEAVLQCLNIPYVVRDKSKHDRASTSWAWKPDCGITIAVSMDGDVIFSKPAMQAPVWADPLDALKSMLSQGDLASGFNLPRFSVAPIVRQHLFGSLPAINRQALPEGSVVGTVMSTAERIKHDLR
ncbi:hypothetical protein [uncultured Phyllobacterium sp.]|uniref:hypothetical protein n=1 Tax=uncultured Phyllobacterium sp. TaxID=253813 RepID=UPI00258CFA1F|nr:hypothetical protein [uncultured Phyllobacterium sp.]